MHSKTGLLYVLLDKEIIDRNGLNIFSLAGKIASGGADLLQLRIKGNNDKNILSVAKKLEKIIHEQHKLLIINDRADIACLAGADGVHLGENDIGIKHARRILGKNKIIGRTVHSKNEFNLASCEKPDYISIGTVFPTKLKPGLKPLGIRGIKNLIRLSKNPVFVIGGINLINTPSLTAAGIKNIAVCRGIVLQKNVGKTTGDFKKCLQKTC